MKRRRLAAAFVCLLLGAVGIACPAKELTAEVTEDGIAVLGLACRNYAGGCAVIKSRIACSADLTCQWDAVAGACRIADRCARAGNPDFAGDAPKAIRVLLIGRNPLTLKAKSRCVPVVRASDQACQAPLDEARAGCAAKALNHAMDVAIKDGLTYSGFGERSDAFPVIAIYQPAALPPACQGGVDDPACAKATLSCPVSELVACAGLAVPVNESLYDITCASCQDGLRFSIGVDTGPCPVVNGDCFFSACAAALESDKSQPAQ